MNKETERNLKALGVTVNGQEFEYGEVPQNVEHDLAGGPMTTWKASDVISDQLNPIKRQLFLFQRWGKQLAQNPDPFGDMPPQEINGMKPKYSNYTSKVIALYQAIVDYQKAVDDINPT